MTSLSLLNPQRTAASSAEPEAHSGSGSNASPEAIITDLEGRLGESLRPELRSELRSLARESDTGLFFEGLMSAGVRQEQTDHVDVAGAIFATITQAQPNSSVARNAQSRLDAILGRGAVGGRAEFLLRRLASEASSPSMLAGMAGAQAVFGLTRMALLSRLAASPTANFFTRGIGARALASVGAFTLEAPSFVAFTRGANAAMGQSQDWSLRALGREVASSYITLGALKATGALSTSAFNRLHGINPLSGEAARLTGLSGVTQTLLPQAATLGGIMLGHQVETRLGLREHVDGATTMVDSLAMLLQFHVAGRLMGHALPQVEGFNQQLNIASERLNRLPGGTLPSLGGFDGLTPALAGVPNGFHASAPAERLKTAVPDRLFMSSLENDPSSPLSNPPPAGGERNGTSLPPPSAEGTSSTPPSSGRNGGGRPPSMGRRLARFALRKIPNALNAIARIDMNRFVDPYSMPKRPTTRPFPRSVESVEQGTRIAMARGQGVDFAARVRRDLTALREFSSVSESYQAFRARQLEIRKGERERLEPVHPLYKSLVDGLERDYGRVDALLENYGRRADETLGANTSLETADAMVDLFLSRNPQAAGDSLQAYRNEAVSRAADNFDVFVPGAIETLFRTNPRLAAEPGAQEITAAARAYDEVAGPRQREAQRLAETSSDQGIELARLREEGNESSQERIQTLERSQEQIRLQIKQIEKDLIRASRGLKDNLRSFLADPIRGQEWLLENALHASMRRVLRNPQEKLLVEVLPSIERPADISDADWENFTQLRSDLMQSSEALRVERDRRGIRSFVDLMVRPFGARDYRQLWLARGNLQRSIQNILGAHENLILQASLPILGSRLDAMDPAQLQGLAEARLQARSAFLQAGETAQGTLNEMKPHVAEYYNFHDGQYLGLREQGMRVGFAHAKALLEALHAELGPERFSTAAQAPLAELEASFGANLTKYQEASRNILDGGSNPRDFNRALEEPLKNIIRAYDLYDKLAAKQELEPATRVIPGFEHYTASWDYQEAQSTRQRFSNILRYARPTVVKILRMFSAVRNDYPYEIITRHFQDVGVEIGQRANPQTFYVQPGISRIARYFRPSRSDFHGTHLDFIGHSANAQSANEGALADNHSSPDIIAKIDLNIPVIDSVFPVLVNRISNNKAGVRLAEVRAAQMQNFGVLEAGRLLSRDPQNYDSLTMPVSDGMSPYAPNALEPVSETWPSFGRVFNINDGATVLSSRLLGISLGTNQGAVRNYPNQRGPVYLENDATSYSNLFLPGNAFPNASEKMGRMSARNQLERALWMMQGNHPETNPTSQAARRVFSAYDRSVDPQVEAVVARLFSGVEEVYPTVEGIRSLERERTAALERVRANEGSERPSEEKTADLNALELLDRVLDVQTRTLLRNRLTDLDLRARQELASGTLPAAETKGVRRLQRVTQARIQLLDRVQAKLSAGKPLDRTETRFVQRMGAAVAGRDNVSGIDHLVEQMDYYFHLRAEGRDLRSNLTEAQNAYYQFVRDWNERRKNPENPEYSQIHVSEDPDYDVVWTNYRRAMETTMNVYNITPSRWNGEIFPDIEFRRDGDAILIQPRGWEPRTDFSRARLWRFLLDDTLGMVSVAKQLNQFDPTPQLYLTMHGRGWGWRMLERTQTQLRLENTENFREAANGSVVIAPTHDSGSEFMLIPAVAQDYGMRAFFMADRKFFDGFWGWWRPKVFGLQLAIPRPKPPAFGLIKGLLGPMDQFGHLSIDRSDRRSAFAVMDQTADSIQQTGKSYIIFPGMTRNPVQYDANHNRYEGPIHGSKGGVAAVMERGGIPVHPWGLINGGIIFPKQNGDAFISRGVAQGRSYIVRPGTLLHREQMVPGNPTAKGPTLRNAVTQELDRQYHQLTGRVVGPPAPSKAKKGR